MVGITADDLIEQMSWACKADCVFCYQKGSPPFMRVKMRMSKEEIKTRLKYYNGKKGLTWCTPYENDEVLNNPFIENVLKQIRRKDKEMLRIITNGVALTPQMIAKLKKAMPLFIDISLNSTNPEIRRKLMRDSSPEIAIQSIPLLRKHKIPFVVKIVAWPGVPFSDIEKTIKYADKYDAFRVEIGSPGVTRYLPDVSFDYKRHWKRVVKFVNSIKRKYNIPIVSDIYIDKNNYRRWDIPVVQGTIKHSPAYTHGVKPGDVIEEVNGQLVDSLFGVFRELLKRRKARLKIRRGGKTLFFNLKEKKKYPYLFDGQRMRGPFGIRFKLAKELMLSDDDIIDIKRFANIHRAKRVLVLTSARAYFLIKYKMEKLKLFKSSNARIKLAIAENKMYGGNTKCANLLVVDDYIHAVKKHKKEFKPDLVVIPSSPFNAWERDVVGRVNLDIERETKVPVEFVYNEIL
ncbi:MAG: radical SAM protein [Candidatus Margulisiibacteriota bacterium]|nr:radical SAM protein [Candidatus Margulisiibacteriota bacterium]